MSTWRIYMSGSTRVHKCLCCPCMPEYGSESWTLRLYVCICICEACERYLSMELSVMKIIGADFVVVWIFCSFNDVFISSYTFKMFWKLIGLLSNYHNIRDRQQAIYRFVTGLLCEPVILIVHLLGNATPKVDVLGWRGRSHLFSRWG